MAILRLEPYSGISGDMFLGAVAPLANAEEQLINLPKTLGLHEAEVRFETVSKCSIDCRHAIVIDNTPEEPGHSHSHDDGHHHQHDDGSHTHSHGAHQRNLQQILTIINGALLADNVKEKAREIFQYVAEAESAVHGIPINEVHFHEVGAVDSIIDIVGAAILICELDIQKTYCDHICTGYGFVMTDHGRLPVPAPATERILHGMPQYQGQTDSELVTPTGAAILKALNPDFSRSSLIVLESNYGAGNKDFPHPNALRASLCEEVAPNDHETVVLLQTNLDDMPGEQLGHDFQQALLERGALDVLLIPATMKKGRPGLILEILALVEQEQVLADYVLEHTSSLGLRVIPARRHLLPRRAAKVKTRFGEIDVKIATTPSGRTRCVPEYDSCQAAAESNGVSFQEVYAEVLKQG